MLADSSVLTQPERQSLQWLPQSFQSIDLALELPLGDDFAIEHVDKIVVGENPRVDLGDRAFVTFILIFIAAAI